MVGTVPKSSLDQEWRNFGSATMGTFFRPRHQIELPAENAPFVIKDSYFQDLMIWLPIFLR
jgi:hypothetical protein